MACAAANGASIRGWWIRLLKLQSRKKNPDIVLASLVAWHIWKERNQRVFENRSSSPEKVASFIRAEYALLLEAGRE